MTCAGALQIMSCIIQMGTQLPVGLLAPDVGHLPSLRLFISAS